MHSFLLYGAYGFTGKIITDMAEDFALQPILAGRNEKKLKALSEETSYPYIAFDLEDQAALDDALDQVKVVLHAAGPFIHTARPMIEACLRSDTHYLDITGEIGAFAIAQSFDQAALEAGIMLMPGVGFDVVPTDCMALFLKEKLPDAVALQLAFHSGGGGLSHGTAITMAENLGGPGAVRKDGKIRKVPLGHKAIQVPFFDKERLAMTIPWGDVFTAYYTTGIPNVETYISVHPKVYQRLKWQKYYNWVLRSSLVRNYVKRQINKRPPGPDQEQRAQGQSQIWGQVTNEKGEQRSARMKTPEGYNLTASTSLLILRKIFSDHFKAGYQTPAGMYGSSLIREVKGVVLESL